MLTYLSTINLEQRPAVLAYPILHQVEAYYACLLSFSYSARAKAHQAHFLSRDRGQVRVSRPIGLITPAVRPA